MKGEPAFVTTVEAGRRLGIGHQTVRKLLEAGELKSIVISPKNAKRVHHRVCPLSIVTFILRRKQV
jgi:hypothetical protein